MRQTTKEKLNDKSRKMIDLMYDEICEGGEKTISISFVDKRKRLKYELTSTLKIGEPVEETETPEENNTENQEGDGTENQGENTEENQGTQEGNTEGDNTESPIVDPEGTNDG